MMLDCSRIMIKANVVHPYFRGSLKEPRMAITKYTPTFAPDWNLLYNVPGEHEKLKKSMSL